MRLGQSRLWITEWNPMDLLLKDGPTVIYYDSYGLDPPLEVKSYLKHGGATAVRVHSFKL